MSTLSRRSAAWFAARLSMVLVCFLLVSLLAGNASAARSDQGGNVRQGSAPFAPQFAVADFDGDQKADLASVRAGASGQRDVLYVIDFQLSSGTRSTVGVRASAGGLQLASRDVNGDHFLDLVVTSLLTGEPIAVLLNDGQGNFTRSEPSAFPEAFQKSDYCLTSETNCVTDRTGALSSRLSPESGESVSRFRWPRNVVDSLIARASPAIAGCGREACRGRAPPPSRHN